jgi:putative tricarboxylic transport membrane protein
VAVARGRNAAGAALQRVLLVGPLLPSLRKKRELVALDEGA